MIVAEMENIKTGKEWMPNIPEHWQMIRVKNLFNEIDKRSLTGKEDLLSVSQYTGVTLRKDSFEEGKEITNAKTLKGYKIVEQGDLVVNIMLAWNGCLGISSYNGITSPAYCVYRVKNEHNPEYFGYLFSTSLYKGEFRKRSTGIIESRLRLYSDAFFRIFCFVPPKDEQNKIVNILNSESVKITHFIQTKQRFIELLKEQRQNIITNAVTKGIDEMAKMKETGIEWMPQIPEHWDIRRLRYVGQCQNGLNKGAEYFGTGFPFISYIDVYKNESLPFHVNGLAVSSEEDRINYSVVEGDIFFTRTSETVDEIGFSSVCLSTIPNATFSGFLIRFRPNRNFLFAGFSKYFFRCKVHRAFFVKEMLLVTRASLSQNLLKNLPVLLPPIEEQKQIANFIEAETRILDIAISKAEREIELIKEYREAMIAEAVTGKIKF
ncbi:MAG: restriction endonuclease subunit S [Prolixibacteraceae bacterium]|nr:restriction endonuclease subunit S [Prolixibacteraceae bacterium]